jgi:hypothetical protein
MWNDLMLRLLIDLNNYADTHPEFAHVSRGDITFQVANLHVYPRHFDMLARWADIVSDKLDREAFSFWRNGEQVKAP